MVSCDKNHPDGWGEFITVKHDTKPDRKMIPYPQLIF